MNVFRRSLVLAVSMMVLSTIGFASCSNSSTSNNDGGTGGASGAVGGSTGGGAGGTGGSTGSGGHADAGSDVHTGAGGASGTDSGSANFTCANLLACCNSATPAKAQLKTLCLGEYNTAMPMGDSACSDVLAMIKTNGLCN